MSAFTAGLLVLAALEGLAIFCLIYTLREMSFNASEQGTRHQQFIEGLGTRHHQFIEGLIQRHDTELNVLLDRIQAPEVAAASAPMRLSPFPKPDPNAPPTHINVVGRAGIGRVRVPISDPADTDERIVAD